MNQCYGCNTCKSADKPLEDFIAKLPVETSHHRVDAQSTSVDSDCRVCAAVCVRMAPAVSLPKRPAGSVERPQIRS